MTIEKVTQTPNRPFALGENVKIKGISEEQKKEMKIEDYYYIKKFENRIGTISELQQSASGICTYRVEFNENDFGYFYRKDLRVTR